MKTNIITAHEESYTKLSKKILGVIININEEGQRVDSLVYVYHDKIYIIFETMIDMMDYLLNGEITSNRAYITEDDFDVFYDAESIDGLFKDQLEWTTG